MLSIIKEALPFTALSFLILTTLVFVQQVGKYSNIILSFHTSAQITFRFLLSLLPGIIIITLPVALLLGTVITCSRLSADGELTAAQSLGIGKISLGLPFFAYGLIGTLLTLSLSAYLAPRSLRQLKSMRARILLEEATTQIRPRVFITSFPNVLLHVQDVDAKTGDWLGVFIVQQDAEHGVSRLLTSERGQLRVTTTPRISLEAQLNHGLSLENRAQRGLQSPGDGAGASQAASDFDKLLIKLTEKQSQNDDIADSPGALSEMTLSEVARAARSGSAGDKVKARVEWHKRFAFSFACLTLTCMTFIIALRGKRFSTRPRTVVAILFIAMAFYLLLVAGQNIAQSGKVPAWLGAWLSNILLMAYVVKSLVTGKQIVSFAPLQKFAASLLPAGGLLQYLKPPLETIKTTTKVPVRGGTTASGFGLINLINYLIVSEIAKYYLLALLALVATSIIFTLFDLIPAMAKSGSSLPYAMSYLGYLAPQLAYYVSPFAMLVAILAGCSILARSNQLVIISSVGQSKMRIIIAIMTAAFSLNLGLWLLSDYLLPLTNREQDIRYHKIKSRQLEQTTLAFGRKWVLGRGDIIYSYQRIDGDNTLINTSMYYLSPFNGLIEKSVHFDKAQQVSPTRWKASAGWVDSIEPNLTINRAQFNSGNENLDIADGAALFRRTVNESSKMSSEDLGNYISQLNGIGISTTELQLDLTKRIAFPFSCLTLAFLAMPFATTKRARRSSPLIAVAVGVAISLVFWLMMTIFEAAGKQANLPVTLAIWGPQILFLAVGMYLNLKYKER